MRVAHTKCITGVVSVPIYQSNDIVGSLITIVSYVITKQQPLQGYSVRLN